jgi:peptidylprolyl isomerase
MAMLCSRLVVWSRALCPASFVLALFALLPAVTIAAETAVAHKPPTVAEVLAQSKPSDWVALDPQNTLYVQLPAGRVVIELAPRFAPHHVESIKALARAGYFEGLAIDRVQDNFVAQWGDPEHAKPIPTASTLAAEFVTSARDLPFTLLPDPDTYASIVGFSSDFPAAREPKTERAWLLHCYGMVGVGRDNDVDSGNGTEIYVVIGHSPRQLDRNVTLVGRVVQGMELLSSLPRGTGAMGFYESRSERVPLKSVRVAADVPQAQRTALEVMRTDTQSFADLIEARRNRRDPWYKVPAGRIDVCNVPLPVRAAADASRK